MSNNSSKQILLSVIGVAILVVAVVGVSFAFFSYTRTGTSNNQITTGTLIFNFTDTNSILLSDHFPISTADGLTLNDEGTVCSFTVTGSTTADGSIGFNVYAVAGNTVDGKTPLDGTGVFLNIRRTDTDPNGTFTPTVGYGWTVSDAVPPVTTYLAKAIGNIPASGLLLGTGTINGSTTNTLQFEVRMWVDDSVVTLGEGATYTTGEYAKKYYSMKIKVTATA